MIITPEMIEARFTAYNTEFDKRPLPSANKMPLAIAHSHAKDEVINKHRKLPTDRVLVQKRNELSQYEFDSVVKALRLLCELDYKGDTDRFCDLHHFVHTGIDENVGIEINVYDDGYPTEYGFDDDDPVVCVACYHHDCDTDVTDWDYALASFVVHKDFFKPTNATTQENDMTQNVHKPKPSDMCHAIRQAVETMESYLSDSEIKDMIACDQCTLTAEYRPQLTADLERIYDSLDDYDKGVLQDRLDDMWIMYCIARYTDKGAIAHEGCSGQSDSNEG